MSAIMLGLARTNVFAVRVQCNYWQGKYTQEKSENVCNHARVGQDQRVCSACPVQLLAGKNTQRKKARMSAIMLGLARTNVFAVRVQCNYWQGKIHTGKKRECLQSC